MDVSLERVLLIIVLFTITYLSPLLLCIIDFVHRTYGGSHGRLLILLFVLTGGMGRQVSYVWFYCLLSALSCYLFRCSIIVTILR